MSNKNKITLETRENKLEMIKKKGFKKAFFTTVMSMGVLLGCTGMLVGCGEAGPKGDTGAQGPQGEQGIQGIQGVPGVAGSMWFTGTAITGTGTSIEATVENTKVGDIYFNTSTCDLYQCVSENTWNWLANLKGDDGQPGEPGQPGQPGSAGPTGAAWLTGTAVTGTGSEINATVTTARVGDLYFNTETCDVYECTAENTWNWISNIKGSQGVQGEAGKDGTSVYVGYGGYIWSGTTKTDFKVENVELGENVVENTIGIEGTMSEYFAGSYLDLSTNTVALMANYMPNAKLTQYSGTTVTEIKVVADKAGELYIGTAKVADIVNARTTGATYTATTKAYTVEAGLNTITFTTPITVAADETIVLGGNGSVGLYQASGITVDDEDGNYTLINGKVNAEIISEANGLKDTLAICVSINLNNIIVDLSTAESAIAAAGSQTNDVSTYGISNPTSAPWMFSNSKDAFANKALVSIRIPVISVDTITENPIFTIRVAKYNASGAIITSENVRVTQTLQIPLSEVEDGVLDTTSAAGTQSTLGEYVVNKWITLDLTKYNITVNEGETVVFGDLNDTVRLAYSTTNITTLNFVSLKGVPSTNSGNNSMGYLADVVVADYTILTTMQEHLENLQKLENAAKDANEIVELKTLLNGKQFSLLGDSISTYNGYCNDTEANTTLGDNVFRYDDTDKATGATVPFTSVNETWWMQIANTTTMDLLVNNSWAGSEVFGERTGSNNVWINGAWEDRCVQLHDDNGEKEGTNPDLIAVYLGINDYNFNRDNVGSGEIDFESLITDNGDGTFSYATPTEFKDGYAIMIHKMLTKYSDSQIFIFTLLPEDMYSINKTSWDLHNKYIRDVANHFNLPIVDLAEDSGITWDNMHDYLHTDKIHPNEAGMDLIEKCFLETLLDFYVRSK